MPVSKAVLKNAVPAMVAMLMVLVYNLADTFFISQTHDAVLVAAVSLSTPMFMLFMAFGNVFGIGGTSVISRAMGEGRVDYARKVCSFCMWGCVAVGVFMSALILIFMEPLLKLMGASADTLSPAKSYLTIVCLGGPFILISNCYSNIVRAEGRPNIAMTGTLVGNLLNVILDPIMILALKWGVAGAAVATVIGNLVAAGYYLLFYLRGKSTLSIHPRDFMMRNKVLTGVLAIGIPASLAMLLMSVSQIVMNSLMSGYGDMAIAGIGVAMKVTTITGTICMGLGQGVQPLLGYCIGAKTWDRYRKMFRFSLVFAFLLGTAMTLLCYLFTPQIVSVFLTDAGAYDYGLKFARILLLTGFIFGVYYVIGNALQAMGAAKASLIVNLSRQGLIYIPALFVLNALVGADGLAWAQPVSDALSMLLAIFLCMRLTRRMMQENKAGKAPGEAAASGLAQ